MASQVVGGALGYLSILVIGRYFEPASYGAFLFAMGALGLLGLLTNAGFNQAHVHFVARGVDPARALGVYLPIRLALMAAMVVVAGLGYAVWFGLLGKSIADATTVPILLAVLALQLVVAARQLASDTWLGREQVNRTELIKTLDTVLALAFLTALGLAIAGSQGRWTPVGGVAPWLARVLGMESPWSPTQAGLALALAYVVAKLASLLPTAWWWLRDRVRPGAWDAALARQYLAYALPVALAGALAALLSYTDVVMLGYLKTAQEVGQYGMAQKLGSFSLVVAAAVSIPLLPRFSSLLHSGQEAEARTTLERSERYLLLVAVPAGAALAALAGPILHVAVGDRFLGATDSLRLLGVWSVLVAAMTPAGTKVMGLGRSSPLLVCSLISAGLNVPLNLWFIPDWGLGLGAAGAALATLLSTLVAFAYLRVVLRRKFGTPLWDPVLARMAVAGTGAGLLWWGALRWAGPAAFDRFWKLGLWGVAGTAVFALLAAGLGMLRRDDVQAFRRLASPRGLWRELSGRR
jgi:O-antigen/teichoic acid export membrane protein